MTTVGAHFKAETIAATDEAASVKTASENPLIFGEQLPFKCHRCGSDDYRDDLCVKGTHYAKRVCNHCGVFVGWCGKPDLERARRKAGHRTTELVTKLKTAERWFCELCTRQEHELVGTEVLAAHHVNEYHQGGSPDLENLRCYCSTCHKYVHQRRTEAGWYRDYFNQRGEAA